MHHSPPVVKGKWLNYARDFYEELDPAADSSADRQPVQPDLPARAMYAHMLR